jgi:hypothetical protein
MTEQGRSFAYMVRLREWDLGRCDWPRDCGHSRTGTIGHERTFDQHEEHEAADAVPAARGQSECLREYSERKPPC